MANKYWFQTGVNANWGTLTGNWWDDAAHMVQSAALPTTGDFVYLLGATAPDSPPVSALALSGFDTSGLTAATISLNVTFGKISIQPGGTLVMGDPAAPGDAHQWWGTTAALGSFTFNDSSIAGGAAKIGDDAVFNDSCFLDACTIGNRATFNDSASPDNAILGNQATFNDSSVSNGSIIGNQTTLNNSASFQGSTEAGEHTTFNDTSYGSGINIGIGSYALFADESFMSEGRVGDFFAITSSETINYLAEWG